MDTLTSIFMRIAGRLRATARHGSALADTDVDDILQDSFVKLWSKRDALTDPHRAEGTTVVTVRNTAIDAARRRSTHPTDPIDEQVAAFATTDPPPDDSLATYNRVVSLIDSSLSQRDREILLLRDRDGWEIDDLAEKFNLNESNIRVILSRSRKTIRELYRNKNHDYD